MNLNNSFEIRSYDFNPKLFNEFQNVHSAKDLWPIVYLLSDDSTREAYVGETTDAYARMSAHLKSNEKVRLTTVHLITSEKFNKSATLDIESNLIKYISGDGQYRLQNGNIGLANHNYFQKKELYWGIFKQIWNKLREQGISKHSLEYIENSDLFKYSPYKSLSTEQKNGLKDILSSLLYGDHRTVVVEGGAGTGKTIMAVFLFKLLNTDNEDFNFKEFGDDEAEFVELVTRLKEKYPAPRMALVVPMSSFRKTLKKVFKNVKGLNAHMVKGPSEIIQETYDIIVVDESHRLRRRVNLGTYFGVFDKTCAKLGLDKENCSELDWVLKQSRTALLFYDDNQSIKPSDVRKEDFDKLKASARTKVDRLVSQFRVKGGNDYIQYVHKLLGCSFDSQDKQFNSKDYELVLFDSIAEMVTQIKHRNDESGLARLVAGYSWEWVSKGGASFDIKIENTELKWNSVSDDWVNSPSAAEEVGCIHTTQGYDLNYAGVIFGNEISYDKDTKKIIIIKENYFDKNGKQSITDPAELKDFIINIYKTIMLRGIKGTYVYACDRNLREYLAEWLPKHKVQKVVEYVPAEEVRPFENAIPVYDLKAAAGGFSELQNVSDYQWVAVPARYKPGKDLFACMVVGESMNQIIPNGSLCLFRRYSAGSRNGKIVLVEHTSIQDSDFGSGYTVKEYHSRKNITEEGWSHESITLRPLSSDPTYADIELAGDEVTSLKVIGIFECVL